MSESLAQRAGPFCAPLAALASDPSPIPIGAIA